MKACVNYAAPLEDGGAREGWTIDALLKRPDLVYNFRRPVVEIEISDLRDASHEPTLDSAGFERLVRPTEVDQRALAEREESALAAYQQEMAAVLKARIGADKVVIFDATSRHRDSRVPSTGQNQAPQLRVHVDQNPRSARARLARHAHTTAEWPPRRFQIINLWRPLLGPVRNYPLALCDYSSVNPATDLVRTRLRFPPWLKVRENYSVTYSPRHRWYYWSALSPDEFLAFKCYDSASRTLAQADGEPDRPALRDVAGLCPHTAVMDPVGPNDGWLRTSLELRALVLYR